MRFSLSTGVLILVLVAAELPGQEIRHGRVARLYDTYCASCHLPDLNGGTGGSLVDGVWKYGADDESVARVIREGLPDAGMPGYGDALSEEQIRSLVVYIRERANEAQRYEPPKQSINPDTVRSAGDVRFRLEPVMEEPGIFWGMDFLPDGRLLVTEISGDLFVVDPETGKRIGPVSGTPRVWHAGQGGLLDVAVHPDYADNGWIYLGYSEKIGAFGGMTAVARGRIRNGAWVDQEILFSVEERFAMSGSYHFGTRIVLRDGYLYFAIGDRGSRDLAQDLTRPNGKIHRLHDDGRIPDDNPFVDRADAYPTIWTYGNRNPQGLDLHPETDVLWETEHGPRGGDELNIIRQGANYGWPVITHGMNYSGTPITDRTAAPGMEQPVVHWTPSIAVCGMAFYTGDRIPAWTGDLFVTGLVAEELRRVRIRDGEVTEQAVVFKNLGRVRDVADGPDGFLYVIVNDRRKSPRLPGRIVRLVPEG
ncbi:MAG: PQQ-dependent sugar dehydrogenase [Opitutales bacterium]